MPSQSAGRRGSLEAVSVWVFFATIILALIIVIPSATIPASTTKTFVLGAGALLTLALYILARLSRGNIILPPFKLVAALWLPTIAYGLAAAFSGSSFPNSLWGSALETDTFGFMLIVASLGTLAALVLRRSEQYALFLRTGAMVFGGLALLQTLVVLVGQVAPNSISPAFSLVGSRRSLSACPDNSAALSGQRSRNAEAAQSRAIGAANDTAPLRRNDIGIRKFDEVVALPRGEQIVSIAAFCLMPSHFHLVVRGVVEGGVTTFMRKLGTAYTLYFNDRSAKAWGYRLKRRYYCPH